MKRAHGHQNIAPSGDRLSPYTVMLLKFSIVSIICLLIAGCDRYDKKPVCSSTIDKNDLGTFSLGPSGTAFDWKTETVWYRCPGGSYFSLNTCSGDSLKLNWDDAVAYAQELSEVSGLQWRLATLSEVKSIISPTCVGPAVNPNVFPSLKSSSIWTSSESRGNGDAFKCAISTYNGAYSCRRLKKVKTSFLLIHQPSSLLSE
jgi:hypothetical protein